MACEGSSTITRGETKVQENKNMPKIPLHNLFEDALKLRDIDNAVDLDKLIAKLEAEAEKEGKKKTKKAENCLRRYDPYKEFHIRQNLRFNVMT